MKTITELSNEFIQAKKDELNANQRRVHIEEEMIKLLGAKPEGSETHPLENGMKLTITGKLTYSADIESLKTICEALPAEFRPLKTETKLDETGAKFLRANEPAIWALVSKAITVKPAKTSVTIKV